MNPLLYIFLAFIAVALLAYLIVNKIPKKFHWILSLLFLGLIAYLSSLIYSGVMKPIHFKKKKIAKYAKVIDNIKMIKDAQVAHRKIQGGYLSNPSDLIKFIDTGRFPITEIKTIVKKVRVGNLKLDREERVVSVVGYRPVKDDFVGRDYNQMFSVPGTSAQFEMEIDTIEKSGIESQVFRARIAKDIILAGMDRELIAVEKKALGGVDVRGEYISVGSLSNVKVIGNWPPFYDIKK